MTIYAADYTEVRQQIGLDYQSRAITYIDALRVAPGHITSYPNSILRYDALGGSPSLRKLDPNTLTVVVERVHPCPWIGQKETPIRP